MKKLISSLLALAMVLALFSGVVVFNASAAEVQMHIDFINQYTLAQAQRMGITNTWVKEDNHYSNSSNYSFSKDDQGRTVITLTTPSELSSDYHSCTAYLSTGTSATPYLKDSLIDGINVFGDAELSNKSKIAIKIAGDANFTSAFTGINLMLNSSTERVVLSLQGPTKSNGYLIYNFTKIERNKYDESGIALPSEAGNFNDAYDSRINTLNMAIVFNKVNTTVSFWFEDVYLVGTTDTVALHKAIRESKEAGVAPVLIEAAEAVYRNTASTQAQVDEQTGILNEALNLDKSVLIDLITKIAKLDTRNKYTAELDAAREVINSPLATQAEVDAQVAILQPIYAELNAENPAFDRGYTYTQLPGIQDWTDDMLAVYNEQAALTYINDKGQVVHYSDAASPATFATTHLAGKATKSLRIAAGTKSPNNWTYAFSTSGNVADRAAASQIGNVLGEYDTPAILSKYSGIRIAVQNERGEEPQFAKSSWDPNSSQIVACRFVSSNANSWNNHSYPYASRLTYYRYTYKDDNNNQIVTYPNDVVYYNGYYYFYFRDFNSGWSDQGKFFESQKNNKNKYGNLYFWIQTSDLNTSTSLNGGAIYISDMQLFTAPAEPTQDNLMELVSTANELDVFGVNYDVISAAEAVANNAASEPDVIENYMFALYDIISEIQATEADLRTELDNLIELADNMGMFVSSNPNYDAIVLADQTYSSPNSSFIEIAKAVSTMRDILSGDLFGDDLSPVMVRFYNTWKYNFTPATYAAFARAVNAVWADPENVDEETAYAAVSAAANALEPVRTFTSEESWFADWTTEQVNEVVAFNPEKLCDSIGRGLNLEGESNAGDFTNNTVFTAGNGAFSMTAQTDFNKKSMGWKNMDRKGGNPGGRNNDGYPALNFTSIKNYGGIRLKIDVTGGTAERLLIGISNCMSMSKEDYAIKIKPEYVDEDGYINIPFSYFEKASWSKEKFSKNDLDDVIVFIVEAYNVTNGTTVTISDVRAYTQVLVADNKVELFRLLNEAASLDDTGRYYEAIKEANDVINDEFASEETIAATCELLERVIDSASYEGDGAHYFDAVSLPFFQDWTASDVTKHNSYAGQSKVALSENCLIGDAFQSVKAAPVDNNTFIVSNCKAGTAVNTAPQIGDPFEGFGTDFGSYDGIRIAVTDNYGLTPSGTPDSRIRFTLYSDGTASGTSYTATYNPGNIEADPDYIYIRFKDMLNSNGDAFDELGDDDYEQYRLFTISFTGTGIAELNTEIYFSDVQFYSKHDILPRDELIELIENIKRLDIDKTFADDIADAEELRDDIRATQEDLDEMVAWLTEIYDALADNGNFDPEDIVATFGAVADPQVAKSEGTIKLLMIGNSFSVNAYTYINQIAQAAGVNLICANLQHGGCSLKMHYDYMTNNKTEYSYSRSWGSNISDYTAAQALADQDWDYISIQQVSGYSGDYSSYQPYMHGVIEYIKSHCPNAEIIWHQTWAYQKTSTHSDFPKYNNDQDYMWECIESASRYACNVEGIRYIVPSGKAFQNARDTAIGDNLNSDGYHANSMGCYLAGYCFFSTVTGSLPNANSYRPSDISEANWKLLRKAVTDAVTEYGYVTYRKDGKYVPAFEKFKRASSSKTIDGMMIAGNLIAESLDDLDAFKAITSDYMTNNNVMFTVGEGDLAISATAPATYASQLNEYCAGDLEEAAQKNKGNRHIKVNGIDIIGVTNDGFANSFATYSDETLEWLDSELAAIESDMPIFVVTSHPVSHTIGSRGASRICDVLKKYNVIVFSGGSNAGDGVANDLIIHHDGVTFVNVGSLSDETANGLMVEVDSIGNVRVRRYDFILPKEYNWFIINADGTDIEEYEAGYYEAPEVDILDGTVFDLTTQDAPVMTWLQDGEKATLDGEPCEYGTEVTEPGEHTLVVTAGDKSTSVTFTVVGEVFEEPVVSIADGAEFGIPGEPVSATWTPEEATATLNGEPYAAGTVIGELGEYTLVVTNGDKSVTVNFTIVDNYMTPEVSVADGTEFKLSDFGEGPLVITWTPEEATATLNGEEYTHTHIGEPGEYTLVVTNGTKSVTINFTIVDDTPVPEVNIADGAEFDLYTAGDPIVATWTPEGATATLNGEEYLAGTAITEVGEYVLVVTNGSKSVTVNFTVIDTKPAQKRGDFNGDGKITVADALDALRIAARLAPETPEALAIADIDRDGKIGVNDALAILRVAARLADDDSLK